jgi:hypothetical protein
MSTPATKGQRGPRPNMGNLLSLDRIPALAPKFANQIGKTCQGFTLTYAAEGVKVEVCSTISSKGGPLDKPELCSVPEWERRRALKNAPSNEERLSALKRKYELRLNKAFPAKGPSSGSEEDIQVFLDSLAFSQRRALLMSQKDFSKSYPDGFRDS